MLFLRKVGRALLARAGSPAALLPILAKVAGLLPTHTRRSEEMERFQQFSTPLPMGLAALAAARITPCDLVLEPSAGTGLLALLAEIAGGNLALNELADTRADLLRLLFPGRPVTRFDAAQIDDHLDAGVRPNVILMTPPFSAVANVDSRTTDATARHLRSALARLCSMQTVEYISSAHSAFAWLGSARLTQICARQGARLVHKPINLSPVVEAAGGLSFAGRTQAHVDYFFGRDIEHWAEFRGVEVIRHRPTHHDNPLGLASGVIIVAQEAGQGFGQGSGQGADALAHAILGAHWRDDADIADAATLAPLIAGRGLDPDAIPTAAVTDAIQTLYRRNTETAIALNILARPPISSAAIPSTDRTIWTLSSVRWSNLLPRQIGKIRP